MKKIIFIGLLYSISCFIYANPENDFSSTNFDKNPIKQFQKLSKKVSADKVENTNVAVLSTVANGNPAGRSMFVDVSEDNQGFVFYTHPKSNKVKHITKNSKAELTFIWHDAIDKKSYQVRVNGEVYPFAQKEKSGHDAVWRGYILKPNKVQFSCLDNNVVKYVNYFFEDNNWVVKNAPDYKVS